jgi:two-component system response regulator PilR (NtrC family)
MNNRDESYSILVVDDERSMRDFLSIMLKKEGYQVSAVEDGNQAIRAIQKDIYDLVITDIKMPGIDGLQVLQTIKEVSPETLVIMITAFSSTKDAVKAMKQGAIDYIAKPFEVDEIKLVIRNALERKKLSEENSYLKRELESKYKSLSLVGQSPAFNRVLKMIEKVSAGRSTVLILGESGTGKELVARAVHQNSPRRNKPFVTVNCGAIPEHLLESELFGHMKGSFTGAIANKQGLFELADGGTFFLDEIGEMTPAIQVKLLRVLQEKQFKRVGGTMDIKVDIRIIAASNKDLEKMVAEGAFREDLYYRLNVIPIYIEPLRNRKEDIPLLVDYFLKKYSGELGKVFSQVGPEAMKLLVEYDWPGNVRELENAIERAIALESGSIISSNSLPDCVRGLSTRTRSFVPDIPPEGLDLENIVNEVERGLLMKALQKSGWVKKQAAKMLHLSFRSLRYRLDKFDIEKPEKPL